jgi:hypothetical protein
MAYGKKRGMSKKRSTTRRTSSSNTKKGLTKTEKSQVKTIAKKAVNSMAETKYFNTNAGIARFVPNPIWRYADPVSQTTYNSDITCFGFTTGLPRNTNSNGDQVVFKYGQNRSTAQEIEMGDLALNQIFSDQDSIPQRAQYAIEGVTIRPSFNEVQWVLERPVLSPTELNYQSATILHCRIVRVVPRSIKGSFGPSKLDPKNDLFLDQLNEPFGVATRNNVGKPVFGQYEFNMAKVNSRRYKVISDKTLAMGPSLLTADLFGEGLYYSNNPDKTAFKKFTTKHNLGKELYYPTPNEAGTGSFFPQRPETGFTNEMILYHFCNIGTQENDPKDRQLSNNVVLTARPVSTFKDI